MNPFELPGPSFLAVYGIFAAALLGLLALLRSRAERPRDGGLNLANAYEIAYLRGGAEEALGAAVASLLDRRLLWSEGLRLRAAPGALETTSDPVERAILSRTSDSEKASRLLADPGLKQVARAAHHGGLVDEGLLPSAQQLSARLRASAVVLVLLGGSAIYKVALALQRGRHNVGFLILLALLACGLTLRSLLGRRTRAGDQRLAALRTLYAGLKGRAWNGALLPGSAAAEVAMLVAVFGPEVLPSDEFAATRRLLGAHPSARHRGDDRGASAAAGCGGGGGGGCGGGGGGCGGGGGGGCGGCGS